LFFYDDDDEQWRGSSGNVRLSHLPISLSL